MPPRPPIVRFVVGRLTPLADPQKAGDQAAYMRTTQPFFGVMQAQRVPVSREMCRQFPPKNSAEYQRNALALWNAGRAKGGQRDLQYAALFYLERFKAYHTPALLPLCKKLVEQGAWWDLVDWIATKLVSPIVHRYRRQTAPMMRKWIEDDGLWVRRTAILSQLTHKRDADLDMLFAFCLARAGEREFFIRKAIGWALRQQAHTHPKEIRAFLTTHKPRFSNLTVREGGKHIGVAPTPPTTSTKRKRVSSTRTPTKPARPAKRTPSRS